MTEYIDGLAEYAKLNSDFVHTEGNILDRRIVRQTIAYPVEKNRLGHLSCR